MSTVFQQQGAPLPARIGPKVFADVPSAKELEDAKRAVDTMRRSRDTLRMGLIAVAVALIAAVAAIAFLASQPPPKPAPPLPGDDPAVLKGQIGELQRNLDTTRANLTDAQTRLERFAGLPEAEEQFKKSSEEIARFVADRPTYGDIEKRTIRNGPPATKAQWATYKQGVAKEGRPTWKGEDAAQVKAGIDAQVRDLQSLLDQIRAAGPERPPAGNGGTPCVGPNCPG